LTVEKTLNVDIEDRSYDIFIGNELGTFIEEWLLRVYAEKRVYVVVDKRVYDIYEKDIEKIFSNTLYELFSLEVFEETKNQNSIQRIYEFLLEKECDRESLIVSFGGGVTGDIVGFSAATFMRGVDYIQVPTTLLAQVDSSVGGKTGINFRDAKNVIGAFYQPRAVFIDNKYLATLDDRNFMAGLAEILKVGFIGDSEIVEMIKGKTIADIRSFESVLVDLVARSLQFKADIVGADERESGLRRILNFGHTVGHAIEEATSYQRFLHGEAIAAGMALEAQISLIVGACSEETRNIVISVMEDLGYEILPEKVDYSKVFSLIVRDKKRTLHNIVAPVLNAIGRCELREFQLSEYDKFAAESLNFVKSFQEVKLSGKLRLEILDDLDVLESSGRFNDAENLVTRFLEKDPTNEKMNLVLARLYARQGKNSSAIRVIDEILQLNPGNKDAIAMRREFEESLDGALQDVEQAGWESIPVETVIRIDDDVYRIEGISEDEETPDVGEEEVLREEYVPDVPVAEERTGVESLLEEDAEEGVPIYTSAMAEILLKEGKRDKSIEVLDEILKNAPEDESALRLREIILSLEEKEKVVERYRTILERFLEKIVEAYK
jgi:3-dehydroquinate synthase